MQIMIRMINCSKTNTIVLILLIFILIVHILLYRFFKEIKIHRRRRKRGKTWGAQEVTRKNDRATKMQCVKQHVKNTREKKKCRTSENQRRELRWKIR